MDLSLQSTSSTRVERHVTELDGLRGIAILLVLFHHLFTLPRSEAALCSFDRAANVVSGMGWIGVDLFFVLSGFLITGILLDSKGSSNYFRNFYCRRMLKIFPLYYLFLLLTFYVFPLVSHGTGPNNLRLAPRWPYFLYLYSLTNPFSPPGPAVLTPTWSLSIEEIFYLFWPIMVLLCSRLGVAVAISAAIIEPILCRAVFVRIDGFAPSLYFFTMARLDGLAIGCAVALLIRVKGGPRLCLAWAIWTTPLTAAVVVALLAAAQLHHKEFRAYQPAQIFGYTAVSLLFAAALIGAVTTRPVALRSRALTFFGKYSYFLYLFHLPVRDCMANILPPIVRAKVGPTYTIAAFAYTLVVILITSLLALLSWHIFEKHFLELKRYFPERRHLVPLSVQAGD